MTDNYLLINDDCFYVMKKLIDNGVKLDMILCDLPYNVTRNSWDKDVIDLDKLWSYYDKLIKDNGAIVLFGQDKFTMKLMMSNIKYHRYNLIWDKVLPSGFLNANKMPLRSHEDICVFYKKLPKYTSQKTKGKPNNSKGKKKENINNNYGNFNFVDNSNVLGDMKHPKSILTYPKTHPSICKHPTEKPVELLEFLIKSYTDKEALIMDNCMGSGSTGVACLNTNRRFIGIEKEEKYFNIAKDRIEEAEGDLLNE